ncbi:MAG: chemotaxis protein CheW [Rhodothermales bacterium]
MSTTQQYDDIMQLVTFVLGKETFGVDVLKVQEIIRIVDVTRVPNSPSFVEGVINLRGKILPVIDLRKRFGLSYAERDKDSRIVVIEFADKVVGFLVDRMREVVRVERNSVDAPPNLVTSSTSRYITGVVQLEDRLLTLLDLDRVLTTAEQEQLASQGEPEAIAA